MSRSSKLLITRSATFITLSLGKVLVTATANVPAALAATRPCTVSSMTSALLASWHPMRFNASKYTSGAGLPLPTVLALTIVSGSNSSHKPADCRLCFIFSGEPASEFHLTDVSVRSIHPEIVYMYYNKNMLIELNYHGRMRLILKLYSLAIPTCN